MEAGWRRGDYRRVVEIWQWKNLGGGVDRQTGVSKRGCGVATLATEGASEVFCTTLGAGGRDC